MPRRLLPLLVAACVSEPTGPEILFDPCEPIVLVPADDATADERASIQGAVALWNEASGALLTLEMVEGAPQVPVLFRDAPLAFLGIYERGTVIVNRGLTDDAARAIVLAHELGHAFGLPHVTGVASVMVAGNLSTTPSSNDVSALAGRWGACR